MNNTQVDGSMIFVSRFVYKQENQLHKDGLTPIAQNMKKTFDNNIFVNYIPLDVTEEQVKEKFEAIGKIQSIRLMKKAQKSTQSAMILFQEISQAQKAIQTYHDTKMFGGHKPLFVDFWVSGEEQKQEYKQKNQ